MLLLKIKAMILRTISFMLLTCFLKVFNMFFLVLTYLYYYIFQVTYIILLFRFALLESAVPSKK